MQNKYCLPVIKTSSSEVLATIEKLKTEYQFFEIWLDYIDDLSDEFISRLISDHEERLVFVFRRKDAIQAQMTLEKTKQIIQNLAKTSVVVDLDIHLQKAELDYLKTLESMPRLICSYHNYELTPPNAELAKIVSEIEAYQPEIIKLSTMCKDPGDALRLLKLKAEFLENNQKHIVLGMGEDGKIIRIFGALWGNALIFIPEISEESSAPGQLTRPEFDAILKRTKKHEV